MMVYGLSDPLFPSICLCLWFLFLPAQLFHFKFVTAIVCT